jgi:DNA-binding CsgD family transcriptional regulator
MATVEREIRELSANEIVAGAVPLATFSVSPEELTSRVGVEWSSGSDDLDEYRGCVFETPAPARFALLSYNHVDPPEVMLLGEPESVGALDDVLRSLRVTASEVVDRVDVPAPLVGVEAGSVDDLRADLRRAMEQTVEMFRTQVEGLQAELEISRLASLASIEEAELTPRQREVLQLMVSGLSTQEVADELKLNRATVLRHLRTLRNALVHQS